MSPLSEANNSLESLKKEFESIHKDTPANLSSAIQALKKHVGQKVSVKGRDCKILSISSNTDFRVIEIVIRDPLTKSDISMDLLKY
jgi:hypothetical protein